MRRKVTVVVLLLMIVGSCLVFWMMEKDLNKETGVVEALTIIDVGTYNGSPAAIFRYNGEVRSVKIDGIPIPDGVESLKGSKIVIKEYKHDRLEAIKIEEED